MHAKFFPPLLAGVLLLGLSVWVHPATVWAAEVSRTGESSPASPLIIHLPGSNAGVDAVPETTGVSPAQVEPEPAPSPSNSGEPGTLSGGERDTPPADAGNESAAADPAASGPADTTEATAAAPESAGTTEVTADAQAPPGDSTSPPDSDPAANTENAPTPEGDARTENEPAPEVETEAPKSPRILLY